MQQSRCFSGIPLLPPWSNECWQCDFWCLCLFKTQLVHLEILGLLTAEAWLGEFWTLLACEMSAIVRYWAFFGIAFLWDWNENWPFPVLWPLLSFPNLLMYRVQHFHSIIFVYSIFYSTWYYFYLHSSHFLFPSTHCITSVNLMGNLRFIILLLLYICTHKVDLCRFRVTSIRHLIHFYASCSSHIIVSKKNPSN